MLKIRLITAAVISIIVIYILSFSPTAMFYPAIITFVALVVFFSGTEFAALRWNIMDGPSPIQQSRPRPKTKHFLCGISYGISVLLFATVTSIFNTNSERAVILSIAWLFFCFFIAAVLIYKSATNDINTASNKLLNYVAGFVYLALPCACLIHLLRMQISTNMVRNGHIYFCLATVLMGDTGAFFIGSKFGKHKLIPRISPKKSVEGSIGGLIFSSLSAVMVTFLFKLPFPVWYAIIIGVIMGIAGQIGDLIESAFKRAGGFKDSGHLLPGHGGFLDRIDSLILGIPVAYVSFSIYVCLYGAIGH